LFSARRCETAKAKWDWVESPFRFSLFFEHDLFGKPVATFPDHAFSNQANLQGIERPWRFVVQF
jgi:hypothetical protein